MNRTLILLLTVVILGGLAGYAYLSGKTDAAAGVSARSNDRQFAYPDFEDVERIFIADRKGHQVNLTRGGITGWLADGQPANDNVLKNLITVLKAVDIRTLPTRKAIPNMIRVLATEGIRVQLFDDDNRELRDYYIGGATHDELGTFAIMDGSENPYVVHLPNFTGNIRTRFNHWGDEWRDRIYFRVDPEKVTRFRIEYPRQQGESFQLTKEGARYLLAGLTEDRPVREIAPALVERALSQYEKYYVNRYENRDTASIEQARQLLPFAIISLQQEGQEAQQMKIYPRYQGRTFTHDSKSGEEIVSGGLQAYNAFINEGQDWVLLNVETTQPLLVGYSAFQ